VISDNCALIRCQRNSSFRSARAKRYFPGASENKRTLLSDDKHCLSLPGGSGVTSRR
jgi:hypothetical protein